MKDIFTDLYKKVARFFQAAQEKEEHAESKNVAVNRMKLVLMQDRTNLTPFLLERMRGEMIDVLAKYVEMDKEALELSFEQEGEQMALMLSIPVLRAKDEEEIQAIIKAEDEAKAKAAEEEEAEEESDTDEDVSEEEVEETDEDEVEQPEEEEVCSCETENMISESPDVIDEFEEEIEEEASEKKSKKKK